MTAFEESARAHIRESFAHEQKYSDGMIFRNIRHYHLKRDKTSENIWWARLTDTKSRDLHQLIKNENLTIAFDNLVDFPGLWQSIQLGKLHRLHGLRCQEVRTGSKLDRFCLIYTGTGLLS